MDIYFYKLRFKEPTHFGQTGIDLENLTEWVNSDTLFSALMNTAHTVYGGNFVSDYVEQFNHQAPFLISSLFLYAGDRFFLPRPLADGNVPPVVRRKLGKSLKKLKWLGLEHFYKWTMGEVITEEDVARMESIQKEYKKAFTIGIRPRVSLDRTTQNSNIYHCGYLYFTENSGLYGFVVFHDQQDSKRFKDLLAALGGIGLGGEKTYGCGTFDISIFETVSGLMKNIMESKTGTYTSLSLYHPSDVEMNTLDDDLIAYDIVRKRGWITSGRYALPLKRKSVGFICEGSVSRISPRGTIVDVTPDNFPPDLLEHKVYRYGYAFTAPFVR
jgi:CRISPR-associated protein Csm4